MFLIVAENGTFFLLNFLTVYWWYIKKSIVDFLYILKLIILLSSANQFSFDLLWFSI